MLKALCAETDRYHSRAAREDRAGAFPLQEDTSGGLGPQAGWNRGANGNVENRFLDRRASAGRSGDQPESEKSGRAP